MMQTLHVHHNCKLTAMAIHWNYNCGDISLNKDNAELKSHLFGEFPFDMTQMHLKRSLTAENDCASGYSQAF